MCVCVWVRACVRVCVVCVISISLRVQVLLLFLVRRAIVCGLMEKTANGYLVVSTTLTPSITYDILKSALIVCIG